MKLVHGSILLSLLGGVAISPLIISNPQHAERSPSPLQTSVLQGKEIVGTTITSFDEQGQSQTLKIDHVQIDPHDPAADIYLYTVLAQRNHGQWQNFCQPDPQGMAKALPLAGRWDQTGKHINDGSITFACTNGALAKCVRWGYKPWKTVKGQSLKDYHQACTRMVTADYCGDGVGHTRNGTPIDVYDRLGLLQRTSNSGMTFEAAWSVNGMVYLHRTRFPKTMTQLHQDCPEKLTVTPSKPIRQPQAIASPAILFNDSFVQTQARQK